MGGFSHCQGSQINPLFTILPKEFTCCLEPEESMNSVYKQCRVADNSIGPLEIRVVNGGTFEELMDHAISRGVSINQYKVPKCVNFTPIVELLDSRVISSHFSQFKPHWTPDRKRL